MEILQLSSKKCQHRQTKRFMSRLSALKLPSSVYNHRCCDIDLKIIYNAVNYVINWKNLKQLQGAGIFSIFSRPSSSFISAVIPSKTTNNRIEIKSSRQISVRLDYDSNAMNKFTRRIVRCLRLWNNWLKRRDSADDNSDGFAINF